MLHKAACSRAQTKARQMRLYCVLLQIHALTSTKSGRNLAATLSYRSWKMKHWPVPNRVEQRSRALQTNVLATETLAANWVEKAEQHRVLAFQLAQDSLK